MPTFCLELVRDTACTACDRGFAALAEQIDRPLVTMDAQLLRALPGRARPLR